MLRKVRLYGSLAKFVGTKVLEADISTAAEAVRFLVSNFEGLEQHMADKYYKVITHTALTQDELHDITNVDVIKIVPVVQGSGPIGRILAGIALIAVSFIVPFGALLTPAIFGLGASLALGGIAQLITPVPKIPQGEDSITDPKRSYNFSGIQQTSRAGTPVPLVYGKTLVGSVVISAGTSSDEGGDGGGGGGLGICKVTDIKWVKEGEGGFGPTSGGLTIVAENFVVGGCGTRQLPKYYALLTCEDTSVITTSTYEVKCVEPMTYDFWRAVDSGGTPVTGWRSTATTYPYWSTPFNEFGVTPVSQPWFGGGDVNSPGAYGGFIAALIILRVSNNALDSVIRQWSGLVTPGVPFPIERHSFEFKTVVEEVVSDTITLDVRTLLPTYLGREFDLSAFENP